MEKTIYRAMAVSIVASSVVMAAFVGSRVDQTTIALLGGTFIGLLVAVPTTILVAFMVIRRREDNIAERMQRFPPPPTHFPPSPPQYWVMPNQMQADPRVNISYPPAQPQQLAPGQAIEFSMPATRRRFYMIGESGEVQEIEAAGYGPVPQLTMSQPDDFVDDESARF
jgi:hypothetical protein